MIDSESRSRVIAISAMTLPIGAFAAYVAYLVIPLVVRVVVPSVVMSLTTR